VGAPTSGLVRRDILLSQLAVQGFAFVSVVNSKVSIGKELAPEVALGAGLDRGWLGDCSKDAQSHS